MKPEKQCERCEHNYKSIHCTRLLNMTDAKKQKCLGFMKRIPKKIVKEIIEKPKPIVKTDYKIYNDCINFLLEDAEDDDNDRKKFNEYFLNRNNR